MTRGCCRHCRWPPSSSSSSSVRGCPARATGSRSADGGRVRAGARDRPRRAERHRRRQLPRRRAQLAVVEHPGLHRDPHGHVRRSDHAGDAVLRDARRDAGDGLLDQLHARRPALRLVLRDHLALRRVDADAGARGQPAAALLRVGAGRALLDAADRLLQRQAVGRRSGEEGVHHDAHRRCRAAHRHHHPVHADTHLQHPADPAHGRSGRHQQQVAHRRRDLHVRRRLRQVGAVPAARLAAGRDGGPDARVGADPRGDHGRRRRLPGRPYAAAVRISRRHAGADHRHRPDHDAPRRVHRPRAARHQARRRLLHAQQPRADDGRARLGRGRRGDAVPLRPLVLQGVALPRERLRHPRDGAAGGRQAGRSLEQDARSRRRCSLSARRRWPG